MNVRQYDIVIVPPPEIAAKAIQVSQNLRDSQALFCLDGINFHPHISLFNINLSSLNLRKMRNHLRDAVMGEPSFTLLQTRYRSSVSGWTDIAYEKSEALLDLHEGVIAATKDLRARLMPERNLSEEEKQVVRDCGWPLAHQFFAPHLTFTKLAEPQPEIIHRLPERNFSFRAETIGLYELGQYGTCVKLIDTFPLAP